MGERQKKDKRRAEERRKTKERQKRDKRKIGIVSFPPLVFPKIASLVDTWCRRLSTAAFSLEFVLLAPQLWTISGSNLRKDCLRFARGTADIDVRFARHCQCVTDESGILFLHLSTEGAPLYMLHSQTYTVTAGEPNLHSGRAPILLLSVNASSSASAPDGVTILPSPPPLKLPPSYSQKERNLFEGVGTTASCI